MDLATLNSLLSRGDEPDSPETRRWKLSQAILRNATAKGRLADASGPLGDIRSYAAPTLAEYVTGGTGNALSALAQKFGLGEHDAMRLGSHFTRSANNLDDLVLGARSAENSAEDIGSGRGTLGDVGNLALHALPFVGGSAARLAVRGATKVAPGLVDTLAGHLGAGPEYVMRNGYRVYHAPEGPAFAPRAAGPRPFAVDTQEALPAPQGRLTDQSPLAVPVGDPYTPSSAFHAPPPPLALAHQPKPWLAPGAQRPTNVEWWPHAKVGLTDPEAAGWTTRYDPTKSLDMRYIAEHPTDYYNGIGYHSPEAAMDDLSGKLSRRQKDYSPEGFAEREARLTWPGNPDAQQWLGKALAKYLKTGFGAAGDPLAKLAAQGKHYDPGMTPEKWTDVVNSSLGEDTIGDLTVPQFGRPKGDVSYGLPILGPDLAAKAPWLLKKPATDPIFQMKGDGLDLEQFHEGMDDLIHPESTLPPNYRLSLANLKNRTFPDVVKQVAEARGWREQEAARVAEEERQRQLAASSGPAVTPYRDYPGDPEGMNWVEIKKPDTPVDTSGYTIKPSDEDPTSPTQYHVFDPAGQLIGRPPTLMGAQNRIEQHAGDTAGIESTRAVRDALKYEGDNLNHCIGRPDQPYCNEVLHGAARAFSLRDAEGTPHATILTEKFQPYLSGTLLNRHEPGIWDQIVAEGGHYDPRAWLQANRPALHDAVLTGPDSILQIKSHYNSPVREEHRPYVQDFVNHQPWDMVGDVGNAHLVRLPDDRFMDADQYNGILDKTGLGEQQPRARFDPNMHSGGHDNSIAPDQLRGWPDVSHHFEPPYPVEGPAYDAKQAKLGTLADELGGIDWEPDPAHGANRRYEGQNLADVPAHHVWDEERGAFVPPDELGANHDAPDINLGGEPFADGGPVRPPVIRLGDAPRPPVIRIA